MTANAPAGRSVELPVVDTAGDLLVGLAESADETFVAFEDAPMPLALVTAWVDDRCLLVLDRWKGCHELPGGTQSPGESVRTTAAREFTEETLLAAPTLRLLGVATFELGPAHRREHAAVYGARLGLTTADADHLIRDFVPNDEIDALNLWDPTSPWPGPGGELDAAIVRWASRITATAG